MFSFNFGVTQKGSQAAGGGGGAGKCQVQDFSFVKKYDKASPVLWQKCCTGDHIANTNFVVRKAGGEQLEYIKMKFIDVIITSVTMGGSGEDEIPMETINFSATEYHIDYQEQDKTGRAKGGPVHGGWNVKKNVKI